jgi:hypothetical protein
MKPAITRSGAAIATAVAALIFTVAVPVGPVHAGAKGKMHRRQCLQGPERLRR